MSAGLTPLYLAVKYPNSNIRRCRETAVRGIEPIREAPTFNLSVPREAPSKNMEREGATSRLRAPPGERTRRSQDALKGDKSSVQVMYEISARGQTLAVGETDNNQRDGEILNC